MDLIQRYLDSKENAWSETTKRSEASRLKSLACFLNKSPEEAYDALKTTYKPYAFKTAFIRLSDVYQYAIDIGAKKGDNKFARFLKENRNAFKNVYSRKEVHFTFEEARERLRQIQCDKARRHAEALLDSGMRISESASVSRECTVKGKGGKVRKVYNVGDFEPVAESTLRYHLKRVGLKPHDLRKLAATRASQNGARAEDLCQLFGWSSITTAFKYLQPRRDDELSELLR